MKEPHVEGSSDPPRPRVMAVGSRGPAVSVDRGKRRPGMELRNHPSGAATSLTGREAHTMRGAIASRVIGPAESKTLCMRGRSLHENREIPAVSGVAARKPSPGRSGKACGRAPDMHVAGKSDIGVVPVIAGNKAGMRHEAGYGGTVHPPRDRKSAAGNPPPEAGLVAWSVGPRTRGRKGR